MIAYSSYLCSYAHSFMGEVFDVCGINNSCCVFIVESYFAYYSNFFPFLCYSKSSFNNLFFIIFFLFGFYI